MAEITDKIPFALKYMSNCYISLMGLKYIVKEGPVSRLSFALTFLMIIFILTAIVNETDKFIALFAKYRYNDRIGYYRRRSDQEFFFFFYFVAGAILLRNNQPETDLGRE